MKFLNLKKYSFSAASAVVGIAIAASLFAALYFVFSKQTATSLVRLPESMDAYKKIVPKAWKATTVERYAQSAPGLSSEDRQRLLLLTRDIDSPKFSGFELEPQYAYDKKERQELISAIKLPQDNKPEKLKEKDKKTKDVLFGDPFALLGTQIQTKNRQATQAIKDNRLIMEAFRDALLLQEVRDMAFDKAQQVIEQKGLTEQKQIDLRLHLESLQRRANELEALRLKYPESAASTRQIVDLQEEGSQRYLPAATQIVALESEAADTREELRELGRSLALLQLKNDFSELLSKGLSNINNGQEALSLFKKSLASLQNSFPIQSNVLEELQVEYGTLVKRWEMNYLTSAGVLFGPTLPAEKDFPWLVFLLLSAFAGGIGGFFQKLKEFFLKTWHWFNDEKNQTV